MYKEEKIINGILHYRTSPNAEFKPYTLEAFTGIVGMLKEEMQKQEQGNIEGKDPITIDCTSMIYNPKGGAIPKIGTKEFNDSVMEMFGGKPTQETTLEESAKVYAESYRCPATNDNEYCKHDIISAFNNGAKWQKEQDKKMYSEEDMKQAFHVGRLYLGREGDTNFEQFIEEFKNK